MFGDAVRRRNPLFESSSPDQPSANPRRCNFLRAPRSSLRRGGRGLWGLVPTRHSLRNLPMINDRLAAHSFKQQSFPREKILYIRNERSERLFPYLPFKITLRPRSGPLDRSPPGIRASLFYFERPIIHFNFL